jgi:hypothetical protein
LSRLGFRPSKVAFLASHSWGDGHRGSWPEIIAGDPPPVIRICQRRFRAASGG